MKVLFVCPFVPWPLENGGKIRTFHLIKQASAHAEIHLRVVMEPEMSAEAEAALGPWCESLHFYPRGRPDPWRRWMRPKLERWFHSPGLIRDVRDTLAREPFHVVHLDELLLARIVPPSGRVPVVQHHHKLDTVLYDNLSEGDGFRRHFDLWKLRRLEAESARRYRHHLLCSQEDAELLRSRHGALDCAVIPSGFDPEHYGLGSGGGEPTTERAKRRLLFLGSMNYGPNVDAVTAFAAEALPRLRERHPDLVFEIVGGEPAPAVRALESEHVVVTGRVPDVRPYLERATMMVVPLRIGGGTRLKIVEALASHTPVVSTRIGAEGLGLVEGQHLLCAEDPAGLVEPVLELLDEPARAAALAREGNRLVAKRFSWNALGEELVEYWERVKFAGNLAGSR